MQKTIFITISRSFITRNILRSGGLNLLKKSGHRIVVFFQAGQIPQYLKDELEDDQVKLIAIQPSINPFLRRLIKLKDYLISTRTTKIRLFFEANAKYFKSGEVTLLKKPGFRAHSRLFLAKLISRIHFLKPLFRWIDFYIFPEKNKDIQQYFDTYKPDLVFSTSIISAIDVAFLKEAKRREIKTVSMPKSWDNITNGYYRFIPDYFLVHNQLASEIVHSLQGVPKDIIHIIGMPVFDWYCKKEIIMTREEHFKKKGLDPKRALLFFGSEGFWAVNDSKIAEKIHSWVVNNELAKPCQLLVRPHYSNVKSDVFKNLRGKEYVVVDNYRIMDFLADKWDPDVPETIDFVNSVMHCDVMINTASTLSLDAACVDRPVINIGFGCELVSDGEDITTKKVYGSDHIKWMLSAGGTEKVDSFEELKKQINCYLLNPEIKSKERALLREKLCYKVDGLSSKRMTDTLDNILLK